MEAARAATAGDLDRVVELARECRAELGPLRGGAVWLDREAWSEPLADRYRALLERADAQIVVGTIDAVALGYGAVVVEPLHSGDELGVVTDLYVESEARMVGLGEVILEALVAFCQERGCVGVDAFVLPGHRASKAFFEDQAFLTRSLHVHRSLRAPSDS